MFNLRLLSFFSLFLHLFLSHLSLRKTLKINWKMLAPLIKACWQRTTIITNNNNNSGSVFYKKKKGKHKQQEQEHWQRRFIYNVQYKFVFIYYDLPFLQILQFKMRWLCLLRNWPTGHVFCCLFFSLLFSLLLFAYFFGLGTQTKTSGAAGKQHTRTHT